MIKIDWQPDQLTWSIDGKVVRTLKKSDTMGSDGVAHYPSTPSRIQLSYVLFVLPVSEIVSESGIHKHLASWYCRYSPGNSHLGRWYVHTVFYFYNFLILGLGMINWDDPDYKAAGHFYALVNKVSVKCSTAQAPPAASNITSYVYSGSKNQSTTPTITFSNHSTLLNGTGRLVPAVGLGGLFFAVVISLLLGINALLL